MSYPPRGLAAYAKSAYQRTTVESASAERRVVLVLDAACAALHRAANLVRPEPDRSPDRSIDARRGGEIGRAISLVSALQSSLDPDKGKELAASLDALYTYVMTQATLGNARRDAGAIRSAADVLETIRSGFRQITDDHERIGGLLGG